MEQVYVLLYVGKFVLGRGLPFSSTSLSVGTRRNATGQVPESLVGGDSRLPTGHLSLSLRDRLRGTRFRRRLDLRLPRRGWCLSHGRQDPTSHDGWP